MRVFIENQHIRQWWVYALLVFCLCCSAIPLVNGLLVNEMHTSSWIAPAMTAIVITLFLRINLKTKIDREGITASFEPFSLFERHYSWKEIEQAYIRNYAPVAEYGGWGVRGFGKAGAYNLSGKIGIQIITNNKERFLIGTQVPEKAEKAIKTNFKDIER